MGSGVTDCIQSINPAYVSWPSVVTGDMNQGMFFVFVYCSFLGYLGLYSVTYFPAILRLYQSRNWLSRPAPKWPKLWHAGH